MGRDSKFKTLVGLDCGRRFVAERMSDLARQVMQEAGFTPKNDDRAAVFDEACAVFLMEADEATE